VAFAMLQIMLAQFIFLGLQHFCVDPSGHITTQWFVIVPILFIGVGHSLMATLQGPIVNKLCRTPKQIP
jgi:hypothetical protein